jgi:hypothetical protein
VVPAGEILQRPPKPVETPGRILCMLRSMAGGETLQQRTEFRKPAKLETGHKKKRDWLLKMPSHPKKETP